MQETQKMWVWSLGREDPLEEEMATHSTFLALEIPWTEQSGGLDHGVAKDSDMTQQLNTITTTKMKNLENTPSRLLNDPRHSRALFCYDNELTCGAMKTKQVWEVAAKCLHLARRASSWPWSGGTLGPTCGTLSGVRKCTGYSHHNLCVHRLRRTQRCTQMPQYWWNLVRVIREVRERAE